jgi:adenine-specific DNA-methyltransferase
MAKTNLTDEEKRLIAEALSNNTEPPPELMTKLFPGLAEKFDVAKLDRAKIVTLEYAGKRSEAAILNQASPTETGSPLQVERCFKSGIVSKCTQLDLFEKSKKDDDSNWQNLIVQGDNLQFLKTCHQNADPLIKDKVKGKVKLIYLDPPFATKGDFRGYSDAKSYSDKIISAEFIEGLRERLLLMREILADNGNIIFHLDSRMIHYAKVILDEIFGENNFINEIIWHKGREGGSSRSHATGSSIPTEYQNLLVYAKNKKLRYWKQVLGPYKKSTVSRIECDNKGWFYTRGRMGRKPAEWEIEAGVSLKTYVSSDIKKTKGQVIKQITSQGAEFVAIGDVWNKDIIRFSTYTKYPTEKPEALLYLLISAATQNSDLVMDVFAGSGTTAAVAEKLGRRWIVCDFGKHAIYTMQKRMLRIGESKALGKDVKKNRKYGKPPKPFCVVSTGAYDFSRIMKLRENKDAYIDFVLGLFQLSRDEKDLSGKYRLTNIFGEKDSDPVEIYPVWDDEYLKNIRIDEDYLKGIILQSGGKLKGNYFIITPETCTLIGDRALKNSAGDEVYFKLLKFPYKILEDVSRSFQIHEQPSSQENVNNLINSTGFYFNDDVEIEVEKTKQGLKIIRFETRILDKQGDNLKGLDGLAMLLVDVDYNGEVFDMDRTVFAKDIGENGEVKLVGLTDSVAVIAIDKHGNESKAFIIKD